jgi:aminopeptidase YwaD
MPFGIRLYCTAALAVVLLFHPAGEASAQTVSASATPNLAIRDNTTITSTVSIPSAFTVGQVALNLDILHTYQGDLIVSLRSPAGTTSIVHNGTGGGTDNIIRTYTLTDFKNQQGQGTWTLTVQDKASGDTGTLRAWGITLSPPVAPDDRDPMQHIEYLSSDAMAGRNSPSAGLDAAGTYVKDLLVKYGYTGPNPTDASGTAYYQSFTYGTFNFTGAKRPAAEDEHAHLGRDDEFGHTLFEHGFYLSNTMSPEARAAVARNRVEAARKAGIREAMAPKTDAELLAGAELAGTVRNVLGFLPGTGPKASEVIVVMAHLDHVGVTSGGVVYNGADDNASGSSVLLSVLPDLKAAATAGELNRSVLFLWTAAEEKGLVGAQYFVDHPIANLGLANIVGVINMDMVGRWDDQRFSVIDLTSGVANYWRTVVTDANAALADPFDRVNRDIQQYYDRQDGAVFSRRGEDVVFLFEGLSSATGGGSLIPEYHTTGDDVALIYRDSNGNKPRRMRDLLLQVIKRGANR